MGNRISMNMSSANGCRHTFESLVLRGTKGARRAVLTAAFAVSGVTTAIAQDAGDAGLADAAVAAAAGYFEQVTERSFPAASCADGDDPEAEGCYTNFVVVSDLEGDGDMDIIFANGGGYYEPGAAEPSVVLLNDGKGSFRDATPSVFGGAASRLRQVAIGDIDGDGDRDLYQPGGYGLDIDKLWVQTSKGVFEDRASSSLPAEVPLIDGGLGSSRVDGGAMTRALRSRAAAAHFGDLDGDGDLDLVVGDWGEIAGSPTTVTTVRLYSNDGNGVFTALPLDTTPPPLRGGPASAGDGELRPNVEPEQVYSSGPVDIDLHDVDGDFDLDLLVVGRNGQSRLFFNDGEFKLRDGSAAYPRKQGPYQYGQELCDVDGDGDLDLLADNAGGVTDNGENITQLNINDGKGFFTDKTRELIRGEPGGDDNFVKCMDVNGDGHFDLAVASLTHPGEKLLLNSGTGAFRFIADAFPAIEDPTLGFDSADFDGDGILDVVTGQGEASPRIDRLYRGVGLSRKDATPPKFRAIEKPSAVADAPIVMHMAVSDSVTSETGEHVARVSVDYEIAGRKQTLPATFVGGDLFRVAIPAQARGTAIKVTPSAYDHVGLVTATSFEIVVGIRHGAGVPTESKVDASTPVSAAALDASVAPGNLSDADMAATADVGRARRGDQGCFC